MTTTIARTPCGGSIHITLPFLIVLPVTQERFLSVIIPVHEIFRVRWKLFMRSSHGYKLERRELAHYATLAQAHTGGQQACEPKR